MSDPSSPPDVQLSLHAQVPPDPQSPPATSPRLTPHASVVTRHWTETVLSISAIVIAAISLWIAIETEYTNRQLVTEASQMVAESSWPYLQIYNSAHNSEGRRMLSLDITNAGVGPAKIETFEVFWNDKPYRTSLDLMKACCGLGSSSSAVKSDDSTDTVQALGTSQAKGMVLRAGSTLPIITYVPTRDNTATYEAFDSARAKISFRVCYCSVFNECWLSDGQNTNPSLVKTCPEPAVPYTE
ncbi:MAG: hypothetical protein KGJ79_17505 [Alphaproteobacteria bacterium]|nr:hypothetical protein [Alphaproteobacteria bacterium]